MYNGVMGFFYKFSDWFVKLAYINILWLLFSSFGLIVIGFFPATFAMFTVIRKLLQKEEISIFKEFWKAYSGDFLKSNMIGWTITIISFMLYFDIALVSATSNEFLQLLYYPLLVVAFLFLATILYVVPTFIHYDLKIFQLFKNSFVMMLVNPLLTMTMLSTVFVVGFFSILVPSIIPFFSGSISALFIMMAALRSFQKVEENKDRVKSSVENKA